MLESTNDMRRKAPFHYKAKAGNAAFTARLLDSFSEEELTRAANKHEYNRSAGLAAQEAFRREAAFALESIIKANIAILIKYHASLPNV